MYFVDILLIHLLLDPFCSYLTRYIVFQGSDMLCRNSSIIVISFPSSAINGLWFILFNKYPVLKQYILVDNIKFHVSLC